MPALDTARPTLAELVHVLAAARPRGMIRGELARLEAAGVPRGATRAMTFSVCCADAADAAWIGAQLRADGWELDRAPAPAGFVTVRRDVTLRPLPLATTVVRLQRQVAARGASVAIVGLVEEPPLTAEDVAATHDYPLPEAPPLVA